MNAHTLIGRPVAAPTQMTARTLGHVLVVSAVAVAAIAGYVLIGLDGWAYYSTPRTVRGYSALHRVLRPSGSIGQLFGIGGFLLMLVPVAYSIRKKLPALRSFGAMKTWLEVHIFCGIVGPVLVTFHTSLRFNGIVSVAYWSMVAVVLSGFVGRYLYVRIPRSLRGLEMTQLELDGRAADLSAQLAASRLPPAVIARIAAFERRVVPTDGSRSVVELFLGELRVRREMSLMTRELGACGIPTGLLHEATNVIGERAALLRQAAYLATTKSLFDVWHVFHMPLVYVMFAIVVMHVAFTTYMGYVPFAH